jgi:hypothetical protein
MAMRIPLIALAAAALVGAAVVAVLLLAPGGRGSLAQAAENMRDQNVRMELELGFTEDGEDVSMHGTAVSSADGGRMRMDMSMTSDGETTGVTVVTIRDEYW